MDPCPFVRVLVGNLALRMPVAPPAAGAGAGVHPFPSPCYCKIRLGKMPGQTAPAPLVPSDAGSGEQTPSGALAAAFHLSKADLEWFARKPSLFSPSRGAAALKVSVYAGRKGSTCGVSSGRLLGKATISLDLKGAEAKPAVLHSGWISVGKGKGKAAAELSLTVRAEPDPRFVFEFDGEPECSPQVMQVGGSMRQAHVHLQVRLPHQQRPAEAGRRRAGGGGEGAQGVVRDRARPVGLPRGARLHGDAVRGLAGDGPREPLQPGRVAHPPAGRRRRVGAVGPPRVLARARRGRLVRQPRLPVRPPRPRRGPLRPHRRRHHRRVQGRQVRARPHLRAAAEPGRHARCSPRGSGDFSQWPLGNYRGFVMSAAVEGEGRCSKPTVEVGVAHVGCAEDAAAFVALAAAVDLSMDACRLFSHKLRKELSHLRSDVLR
ncbi:hypothetical protein ACQ4PT_019489 [Festuca glaucescens]